MRTGDILSEEVFSSLAVGYHRTHNIKATTAIGQSGFKAGGGSMYGKGIYLTYSFDDQQDERMKETYGPFIIRCKINLADFLIFDPDVAMRVYGPNADLRRQLYHFGIEHDTSRRRSTADWDQVLGGQVFQPGGYSADQARYFLNWWFKPLTHQQPPRTLKRPLKGLVFTGRQDGRVIVAYDPSSVIPFAWARVINLTKTRETVRWNKIAAPPLAKPVETMPEFERAYRYFRENGFTVLSRGPKGTTLMGVRGGDYLSIIITEYADRITVKSFCNRIDPVRSKIPGYAEHRGWPLIYQDYTTKLPVQTILDTILKTHDAMKERPDIQVAFTEALLHQVMKPGITIQRQDVPSGDYRRDSIHLTAGSITVALDSPYQDFTSGKLDVSTKPIPLRLGFGDGSRRSGTPSLSDAYDTILQIAGTSRIFERLQWEWPDDLQPKFINDLLAAMKQQ